MVQTIVDRVKLLIKGVYGIFPLIIGITFIVIRLWLGVGVGV